MTIPKKVVKYFAENKNKQKTEVIGELMKEFNYAKSTALLYYSHRNSNINFNNLNDNSNIKSKREVILKFFEQNQEAVYDSDNVKYANELGVKVATYANYKMQYQDMNPIEIEKEIEVENQDKYYNGRLRKKIIFDDSRLFG